MLTCDFTSRLCALAEIILYEGMHWEYHWLE